VKRLVTKFSEPWFKKISRRNVQLLKRSDKTIPEQIHRPVAVTNQLVNLHNSVTKTQDIRSDEIEKISFGLKQRMFDCFQRSTIFDVTAAHFLKLVRSLEPGVLYPLEAVVNAPVDGQYHSNKGSRGNQNVIF
jgi:hypothetical protein